MFAATGQADGGAADPTAPARTPRAIALTRPAQAAVARTGTPDADGVIARQRELSLVAVMLLLGAFVASRRRSSCRSRT